jgi:hypothetical protein
MKLRVIELDKKLNEPHFYALKPEPLPVIEEVSIAKEDTPVVSEKGLNFAEYMDKMQSKPEEEENTGLNFAEFMDNMKSKVTEIVEV